MLSDAARPFCGAPKSTWSYGIALSMLWDFNEKKVNFWSGRYLSPDRMETPCDAETCAELYKKYSAIFLPQWLLIFYNYMAFGEKDSSLLQSQNSLHYRMWWISHFNVPIYLEIDNPAAEGTQECSDEYLETLFITLLKCAWFPWLGELWLKHSG